MAKKTAVIDIGSNSARMVIYEKSSAYAFHLIKEVKSRVRIGEGAYNNKGVLQKEPMQRAYNALSEFALIIKSLKCNKIFCVATSALRDAPNAKQFIKKIKQDLGINIKIIDGKKEAYYGALASINLLKPLKSAITIDIGGGSSELAKIEDGKIIDTISIDLGTVRLKELFFTQKNDPKGAQRYIDEKINLIPKDFNSNIAVGIGGTIRAFSNLIMKKLDYPLETIHGFEYNIQKYQYLLNQIINSKSNAELKDIGIKKDRLDTIKEGCLIFNSILRSIGAKEVVANGSGVREGIYLEDLLRASNKKFPPNFKISVKSLSDRFIEDTKENLYIGNISKKLFDSLSYLHNIDSKYKNDLEVAAKLYNIGRKLSFYQEHLHSFYFIINNLNYNFTHKQKVLIALLVKYHTKKLPSYEDVVSFKKLLPDIKIVNWLSFIISLAKCLNSNLAKPKLEFHYENHTLTIKSSHKLYLAKECIKKLEKPASFAIKIEDN